MSVLPIITLADCGCATRVYEDRSGVEIDYCPLHLAATEMLRLLGLIAAEFQSDPMSVQCFDLEHIVRPAIALVKRLEAKS